MSVHRLSADNGFRYLLRHTAAADVPRGQQTLVDYYVESVTRPVGGSAPGWPASLTGADAHRALWCPRSRCPRCSFGPSTR
jgi:hypothetical protein